MEQTPLLDIIQIQTKPTGLSVSSEFGPIMPETAMAIEHELILIIFSAISITTLSETAPNADKVLGDTLRSLILELFEYDTMAESKKDEEPGKSVSNLLIRPPVQDSTDDISNFFDSDSLFIFFMI